MLYLIVFAPVIVGVALMVALVLGAATAGGWEALEERHERQAPAAAYGGPKVAARRESPARAA